MPAIADEMDRRSLLYSLLMPVMSQAMPGLDKGKCMYLYFVKAESRTPGGHPARPVLTSFYRSRHFLERPHDPYTVYTSPDEAILCVDAYQSMYAQLLCGLVHRADVLRVGAVFASGFLRAIRFLEQPRQRLCRDIRSGTLDAEAVTDRAVRAAVEQRVLLRADPALADAVEAECARPSWQRAGSVVYVGCYLAHCGWNSTLEAIQHGVRQLCCPVSGDQLINCAYITWPRRRSTTTTAPARRGALATRRCCT